MSALTIVAIVPALAAAMSIFGMPWFGRKLRLYAFAALKLVLPKAKELKARRQEQEELARIAEGEGQEVQRKRLLLLRHGQSEWNAVFNAPKSELPLFPIRLLRALVSEVLKLPFGDATLLDSPLSERGAKQAAELGRFLERYRGELAEERAVAVRGEASYCTSNLRRSMETLAIALNPPVACCLSALQEVSRNVDAVALSSGERTTASPVLPRARGFESKVDNSRNIGNVKGFIQPPEHRLDAFAEWAMEQNEGLVVASGHSISFKTLFKRFLPPSCSGNVAARRKIANGGAVACTLRRLQVGSDTVLLIDPESIADVYKGLSHP